MGNEVGVRDLQGEGVRGGGALWRAVPQGLAMASDGGDPGRVNTGLREQLKCCLGKCPSQLLIQSAHPVNFAIAGLGQLVNRGPGVRGEW